MTDFTKSVAAAVLHVSEAHVLRLIAVAGLALGRQGRVTASTHTLA
ncbi:hypothetical protein [Paraburkholderia graminis]|nr:hypothetical protein [Paraburkholderia graminis]MDQ0627268.1 hypothetical protein [Paraburkholderia graminis]